MVKPLSREFLLKRGWCCKLGCENCPYLEGQSMIYNDRYLQLIDKKDMCGLTQVEEHELRLLEKEKEEYKEYNLLSKRQSTKEKETQARLMLSESQRQRAIAEFPLKVAGIAQTLLKLCNQRDHGLPISKEHLDFMQDLENRIKACYRETFGTELGE